MAQSNVLKADLDDIIFEGRNKEYGAYVLRRKYDRQLLLSALGGTILLLLIVFYPVIAGRLKALLAETEKDDLELKEVTLAEVPPLDPDAVPPPPPPPPAAPPPKATIKFVPPVVKKDEEVQEEPEEVIPPDIPDDVAISTKTQEGEKVTGLEEVVEEAPPVEIVEEKPKEDVNKVYTFVEQQPEYPEGTAALLKWINSQLKYPAIARENGIEGTVYVEFVVEKTGAITDVLVKRGVPGGAMLDEEATRVIKQMPAWKPGRQNGNPVRVRFTLPVKFKLS
jgi:protein TonB